MKYVKNYYRKKQNYFMSSESNIKEYSTDGKVTHFTTEEDINDKLGNTSKPSIIRKHNKKKNVKEVRFKGYESDGTSSDSDIGTDIDIDAFKASLV